MLPTRRNRKAVFPLSGLSRLPMLACMILFVHQFVGNTARTTILKYYNIAYVSNRGDTMIELNSSTSISQDIRSVHLYCKTKTEFRYMITMFIWMWSKVSSGLPSYVGGVDMERKKKVYKTWSMAKNIEVHHETGYLTINIVEPFYRQFGQYRCQANGVTKANVSVMFVSSPAYITEQWFSSRFR